MAENLTEALSKVELVDLKLKCLKMALETYKESDQPIIIDEIDRKFIITIAKSFFQFVIDKD